MKIIKRITYVAIPLLITMLSVSAGFDFNQLKVVAFNDNHVSVGNQHGHSNCDSEGNCKGNTGGTFNSEDIHANLNCNNQRATDECKSNFKEH
jgi:hypothetical protein